MFYKDSITIRQVGSYIDVTVKDTANTISDRFFITNTIGDEIKTTRVGDTITVYHNNISIGTLDITGFSDLVSDSKLEIGHRNITGTGKEVEVIIDSTEVLNIPTQDDLEDHSVYQHPSINNGVTLQDNNIVINNGVQIISEDFSFKEYTFKADVELYNNYIDNYIFSDDTGEEINVFYTPDNEFKIVAKNNSSEIVTYTLPFEIERDKFFEFVIGWKSNILTILVDGEIIGSLSNFETTDTSVAQEFRFGTSSDLDKSCKHIKNIDIFNYYKAEDFEV